MNNKKKQDTLYRIKFHEIKGDKGLEVLAENVYSSELVGLITISNLIFRDQTNHVILPTEDEARKRYANTKKLHLPYHSIISIEETTPEKTNLKKLPFLKTTSEE